MNWKVLLLACVVAWAAKEWGGEQPLPPGWWWASTRADTASCQAFSDARPSISAPRPISLRCGTTAPGYVAARFAFPLEAHRGKRVALFAQVRVEGVEGRARLWLRADRPGQMGASYDDMVGRELSGTTDWVTSIVRVDVPADGSTLFGGIALEGKGRVSISSMQLVSVGPDFEVNAAGQPR